MVEITKIALLANTYNGNYETLRYEEENPEAQKPLGEKKLSEWLAEW